MICSVYTQSYRRSGYDGIDMHRGGSRWSDGDSWGRGRGIIGRRGGIFGRGGSGYFDRDIGYRRGGGNYRKQLNNKIKKKVHA